MSSFVGHFKRKPIASIRYSAYHSISSRVVCGWRLFSFEHPPSQQKPRLHGKQILVMCERRVRTSSSFSRSHCTYHTNPYSFISALFSRTKSIKISVSTNRFRLIPPHGLIGATAHQPTAWKQNHREVETAIAIDKREPISAPKAPKNRKSP